MVMYFVSGTMVGILFLLFGIICLIVDKKTWKYEKSNVTFVINKVYLNIAFKIIFIELNQITNNKSLKN